MSAPSQRSRSPAALCETRRLHNTPENPKRLSQGVITKMANKTHHTDVVFLGNYVILVENTSCFVERHAGAMY